MIAAQEDLIDIEGLTAREHWSKSQAYKRANRATDGVIHLGDGGKAMIRKDANGRLWFKVVESEATQDFRRRIDELENGYRHRIDELEQVIRRQQHLIEMLVDKEMAEDG